LEIRQQHEFPMGEVRLFDGLLTSAENDLFDLLQPLAIAAE